MIPTISAIENGLTDSPPSTSKAIRTTNVVTPVIIVLASISFIEIFIASSDATPLSLIKFSLIRSNATTVSFRE